MTETAGSNDLLTVRQVAALIGYTVDTVYDMIHKGHLPHIRLRGRVLVPRPAYEAWLAGHSKAALAAVKED